MDGNLFYVFVRAILTPFHIPVSKKCWCYSSSDCVGPENELRHFSMLHWVRWCQKHHNQNYGLPQTKWTLSFLVLSIPFAYWTTTFLSQRRKSVSYSWDTHVCTGMGMWTSTPRGLTKCLHSKHTCDIPVQSQSLSFNWVPTATPWSGYYYPKLQRRGPQRSLSDWSSFT